MTAREIILKVTDVRLAVISYKIKELDYILVPIPKQKQREDTTKFSKSLWSGMGSET